VPRSWPPLTATEIGDCLTALGFVHDRDESSHQIWVNPKTHQIVPVDAKWQPVGSRLLQHLVKEELKLSRETFYGATKATARKIGLR
jgi:predicted RNA binding protein YcfA (HicA-like mRNA interferase family)